MNEKTMDDFIQLAQANYDLAMKERELDEKRMRIERAADQFCNAVSKIVIALCTVSLIANAVLLALILMDMLSK